MFQRSRTSAFFFMLPMLPAILLMFVAGYSKPKLKASSMNKFIVFTTTIVVLAAMSITTLGHHSFSLFDLTKKVTVKGVVAKIEWTNPHVWVYADVAQSDGPPVRWGIEYTSINHLTRLGMKSTTLKVGETIEFTVNPYADGTPGGRFQVMKLPNGKYFCDVGAAQQFCDEHNK